MKILVVDDDSLAAEMTGAILEAAGFEVCLSENGIDALEKLDADEGIKLVVSDLNMPFMSGLELCASIREMGKKVPFILLTGDEPDQVLRNSPGLDACVTKDFTLDEVLPDLVASVLAR